MKVEVDPESRRNLPPTDFILKRPVGRIAEGRAERVCKANAGAIALIACLFFFFFLFLLVFLGG